MRWRSIRGPEERWEARRSGGSRLSAANSQGPCLPSRRRQRSAGSRQGRKGVWGACASRWREKGLFGGKEEIEGAFAVEDSGRGEAGAGVLDAAAADRQAWLADPMEGEGGRSVRDDGKARLHRGILLGCGRLDCLGAPADRAGRVWTRRKGPAVRRAPEVRREGRTRWERVGGWGGVGGLESAPRGYWTMRQVPSMLGQAVPMACWGRPPMTMVWV